MGKNDGKEVVIEVEGDISATVLDKEREQLLEGREGVKLKTVPLMLVRVQCRQSCKPDTRREI